MFNYFLLLLAFEVFLLLVHIINFVAIALYGGSERTGKMKDRAMIVTFFISFIVTFSSDLFICQNWYIAPFLTLATSVVLAI